MKEIYPIWIKKSHASYAPTGPLVQFTVDCQFKPKRYVDVCDLAYVTMGKMPVETVDLGVLDQDVVNELEEFSKPGKWRVVLERIE